MPFVKVSNRSALPRPEGAFVYCYLRTSSPRPYYVGKGTRPDRLTAKHAVKVPKDWSRIRVLRQGLTEEEALDWERFYVDKIGRKSLGTGPLLNRRDGGEDGGVYDPEVIERISAKVSEHHKNGVYDAAFAPETVKKRVESRLANMAARFGIPEEAYAGMHKSQREQAKQWLKENPGETFDQWLASRKSAAAAAKYKLTEDEWLSLERKQRNCLKEWMLRYPGRNPHDWLAGKRAKTGPRPRLDKTAVLEMAKNGVSQAGIARALGCSPSAVSRIVNGLRQSEAAKATA